MDVDTREKPLGVTVAPTVTPTVTQRPCYRARDAEFLAQSA